jgi:hypothetical protein
MFDADVIVEDVLQRVRRHVQLIHSALYSSSQLPVFPDLLQASPLQEDIRHLVSIANGELDRALVDADTVADVLEQVQRVLDTLFARAYGLSIPSIPASFWTAPGIGQVIAHVQAWLRHDDLISYTQAAHVLFPSLAQENVQAARMRVKRLTEQGKLMQYVDPSAANPTQQVRVSRQAVEALQAVG